MVLIPAFGIEVGLHVIVLIGVAHNPDLKTTAVLKSHVVETKKYPCIKQYLKGLLFDIVNPAVGEVMVAGIFINRTGVVVFMDLDHLRDEKMGVFAGGLLVEEITIVKNSIGIYGLGDLPYLPQLVEAGLKIVICSRLRGRI
jgi:hypothetical protein